MNAPRPENTPEIFSSTLQKTGAWLREIAAELGTTNQHHAYLALRAVLQTLRDCLPIVEAVHLGSQLPMLVRGFYFEGWEPENTPIKYDRESFIAQVRMFFPAESAAEIPNLIRIVIASLRRHTVGEVNQVIHLLPEDLQEFLTTGEEAALSSR
jgi:uncharacterized protein (DUF2267 family)